MKPLSAALAGHYVRLQALPAAQAARAAAACRASVAAANAKGRAAAHGHRWGPDIIPCANDGLACPKCVSTVEVTYG